MRFRGTIQGNDKNAAGIRVPDEVVEQLGSGRRPKVLVTLRDYSYRSSVAPMGGVFMVGVSAQVREAAGVAPGDELDVTLELDTAPREVVLPDDFAASLDAAPGARAFFDGLSYSKKRWFVLPIDGAKTPETRLRRIAKAVTMLREGRS